MNVQHRYPIDRLQIDELENVLISHLQDVDTNHIKNLSLDICRAWTEIMSSPFEYQGVGKRVSLASQDATNKLPYPKSYWVHLIPQDEVVKFQLYRKQIGRGMYKIVKLSLTLLIGLKKSEKERVRCYQTVLYRTRFPENIDPSPDKKIEQQRVDLELTARMNRLLQLYHQFSEGELGKDPKLSLVGLSKVIRWHRGKNYSKLEWEGKCVADNFWEVSMRNKLPSGDPNNQESLRLSHVFEVAESVLYALQKFHQGEKVHRDVKSANILVDCVDKDGRFGVYLTDFDMTRAFGFEKRDRNVLYPFWSTYSQAALPYTDYFGAAVTMGIAVFGSGFMNIAKFRSSEPVSAQLKIGDAEKINGRLQKELKEAVEEFLALSDEKSHLSKYADLKELINGDFFYEESLDVLEKSKNISGEDEKFQCEYEALQKKVINSWHEAKCGYLSFRIREELGVTLESMLTLFVDEMETRVSKDRSPLESLEDIAKDPQQIATKMDMIEKALEELLNAEPSLELFCKALTADLKVHIDLADLFIEVFKEDQELYRYFQFNEEGVQLIYNFNDWHYSRNQKKEMLEKLFKKFPVHFQMREKLQAIRNEWEKK